MKTAVLLEALRRIDEGSLSLSTGVPVVDCFPSIVDGSGFRVGADVAPHDGVVRTGGLVLGQDEVCERATGGRGALDR